MRQYYWSSRMTVVMASDTCKRCCLCKTYSMNDSRLPLVRSTHYKKQFNTFHCGGTIYLSASDTQDCNKTVFRNTETMTTSDMITHLTFWTSFTQRQRQSCTGSGQLTLWILLKCLMMLWTYLFTYFSMCEWVCMSAQDQFSGCLFLCLCVSSLIVWKVFVLHVCIYSCGDVHLRTHLRLMNEETTKGKSLVSYVNIVFFQSTAHKSSILRYAQRHEASSSGLKSNLLVFPKCSGMSVIIDWTLIIII